MAANPPNDGTIFTPEASGAMQTGLTAFQGLDTGYIGKLIGNIDWQHNGLDQNGLALVQSYMGALGNHPLEMGEAPSLKSPVFNQMADGGANQIGKLPAWEQVARGIYQSTVGSFIKQAQENPLLAVAELAGGAAAIGLAAALDVSTAGLATPFLWTAFAMFAAPSILPGLVSSVQNEIHAPSEQNLVTLLINSGTAAVTLGSPVKAFKGIRPVRRMLEDQKSAFKLVHQPGEAVQVLMKDRAGSDVQWLLPEDRFRIVPQTVDELDQEIARRKNATGTEQWEMPIDEHDALIEQFRNKLQEHDMLAGKIQHLQSGMEEAQDSTQIPAGMVPEYAGHKPVDPKATPEELAADLNSRDWYHGTSVKDLKQEGLDAAETSGSNLLGPGLYMTDHPGVAASYAKGRTKSRGGEASLYKGTHQFKRVLNAEGPVPPEVLKHIVEDSDAGAYLPTDTNWEGKSLAEIYKEIKIGMSADQLYQYDAQEMLSGLNGELKDLGYDALVYDGGKRTKGEAHTAVSVLEYPDRGAPGVARFEPMSREEYQQHISDQLGHLDQKQSEEELIPLMKEIGHRYGYVIAKENPMQKLTREDLAQIPSHIRGRVDRQSRQVMAILHHAGEGNFSFNTLMDERTDATKLANIVETTARQQVGSQGHIERTLYDGFLQMAKHLGIKSERMDHIYAAIDGHRDPAKDLELWNNLSAHEKYMAEKLHVSFGIITNYAYRHGHIELPLHRYVPRLVVHDNPETSRATMAHRKLHDSLMPGAKPVANRSYKTELDMVSESQEAEFDAEEGAGTIAERTHRTSDPWLDFNAKEQNKRGAYKENQPFLEEFRSGKMRDINGTPQTLDQFVKGARTEHGQAIKQRNSNQKKIDEAPEKLDGLVRQISQAQQKLASLTKQREQLRGVRGSAAARKAIDDQTKALRSEVRKATTQHKHTTENLATWKQKVGEWQRKVDELPKQKAKEAGLSGMDGVEKWFNADKDNGGMTRDEFKSAINAQPAGRQLLSDYDLPRLAFGRYLRQMGHTDTRNFLQSLGFAPASQGLKLAYGAHSGTTLAEVRLKDAGDRPLILNGDIKLGNQERGNPQEELRQAGYEILMPALGKEGSLNYQPAIYGRSDIVGPYMQLLHRAQDQTEFQSDLQRMFYQAAVAIPKRAIMGSPVWHGKNVFGRSLAAFAQHPGPMAQATIQVLGSRIAGGEIPILSRMMEHFFDPERYHQLKMDHWADGGVPANRFNVHEHVNHLEQELSGQRGFGWAMRTAGLGPLSHMHSQMAEGWFWKTVDDMGTAAYLTKKYDLMYGRDAAMRSRPWLSEKMAGAIAAEYGNNVAGMVNPLYMNKLWRWGRQMLFFAPTWWTTFSRIVGQSLPGSARLSHLMKDHGTMKSLDPVKFNSLDIRHRKEMVRAHRGYFMSMMSAAMMTHDLMNFTLSGHHVWENQKGHEWDLEVDKTWAPKTDKYGDVKHVHVHSIQLYNQMADLLNGMGVGHDWGFGHVMNEDSFKKANGLHKLGMAGAAVGQGFRQEAAGKLSTAINMGVGVAAGFDPYSLFRDGQVQQIERPEALLGALPGGQYAQRTIDQNRRAALRARIEGTPEPELQKIAGDSFQAGKKAALQQALGLPSMYYSGDEPVNGYHFLSEAETGKYLMERQKILGARKANSEKLLQGGMSPNEWMISNEIETGRYLQLLSDTFGEKSTAKSLFDARRNLYQKYKLDDPAQSREEKVYALTQFESDWKAQLDQSSPQAKAAWWEGHTAMWTDADYLYYETQQIRDSIMAHIDGQGGARIRDAQRRLGTNGLPLDPKATDALRAQDPYLWTYHQVMSQLGKSSLVGALAAAYWDPFSNFAIYPDQQEPMVRALDEAGALKGGATLARSSTVRGLAQDGRGIAQAAAPQAGQASQLPAMQGAAEGLSAEAAQEILDKDAALKPNSKRRLPPEKRAELEAVAQGGQPGGQ